MNKSKRDRKKQPKLQLSRETLRALEQEDLTVVHGGAASELYTCRPCSGATTCRC